jgi:hypothetical protein
MALALPYEPMLLSRPARAGVGLIRTAWNSTPGKLRPKIGEAFLAAPDERKELQLLRPRLDVVDVDDIRNDAKIFAVLRHNHRPNFTSARCDHHVVKETACP